MSNEIKIITELKFREHMDIEYYEETAARFFRAAAELQEGGMLGLQITCPESDLPSAFIFSDADVCMADLAWVAESCASISPVEAGDLPGISGNMYTFTRTGDERQEEGSRITEKIWRPDLIKMLQERGGSLQIFVSPDGNGGAKGRLLASLQGEMPLRMRTAFAALLPGMRLVKASGMTKTDTSSLVHFMSDVLSMTAWEHERVAAFDLLVTSDQISLEDMELSIRTYDCLKRAGVNTLSELRQMSEEDLMKIRNLGKKSLEEIRRKLKETARIPGDEMIFPEMPEDLYEPAEGPGTVDHMAALDELTGLKEVKEQIRKITALARMKKDMEAGGRPAVPVNLSMAFMGNPGTAKTTVARILAGIFHETGLLQSGEIIEVGRADLIARYEGQTADKVKHVFERARGHLLFIDEAYTLLDGRRGNYGDEAIGTIVQEMENDREDTIVIFAGYPDEMDAFMAVNPGLRSRVPFRLVFEDYSPEELVDIVRLEARRRGFDIRPEAEEKLADICRRAAGEPAFGNGRFCRNLAESAVLSYAARVYGDKEAARENDFALEAEDFTAEEKQASRPAVIGFCA